MNNFQLYSTNVLLSGLLCWDIYINKESLGSSYVDDFTIQPISPDIQCDFIKNKYLLNQKHIYNVFDFYNNISDKFFDGCINNLLNFNYPIYDDNNYNIKSHVDTYEMGCTRNNYIKHEKMYNILCPVWLEYLNEKNKLSFDLIIRNINNSNIIGKINIPFIKKEGKIFHNNFINYFNDYLKDVKIFEGNDNLFKINFKNQTNEIYGLSLLQGKMTCIEGELLLKNILHRERPLLEVDNMIIKEFQNNLLIAPQLFNFRFHFNLKDIINEPILNMLTWGKYLVSIVAKINDKPLELRDFYNNYEFIPRKNCTFKYNDIPEKLNVLEYLKDNKYIKLIDKNKIYSPIVHWSLNGNNSYIFNLYNGFSGYNVDKDVIINHKSLYSDSPELTHKQYNEAHNNLNWCNNIPLNFKNLEYGLLKRIETQSVTHITPNEFFDENDLISKYYAQNILNINWLNNIKYAPIKPTEYDKINICTAYFNGSDSDIEKTENIFNDKIKIFKDKFEIEYIENVYFILKDSNMYIVSKNKDLLTFAGITEFLDYILNKNIGNNIKIKNKLIILLDFLKSVIYPITIVFNNTILYKKTTGPSRNVNEILYYKVNNSVNNKILRYDGKICPTFLTKEDSEKLNYYYYKEIINYNDIFNPRFKLYSKYLNTDFLPIYPSIGYCPILKEKLNYDKPLKLITKKTEYKWFNCSQILYAPQEFEVNFVLETNINEDINKELFEKKLEETIKTTQNINSKEIMDFIKDKYDYLILNEITELIKEKTIYFYNIKLKLK